jgi:hypothetical protein
MPERAARSATSARSCRLRSSVPRSSTPLSTDACPVLTAPRGWPRTLRRAGTSRSACSVCNGRQRSDHHGCACCARRIAGRLLVRTLVPSISAIPLHQPTDSKDCSRVQGSLPYSLLTSCGRAFTGGQQMTSSTPAPALLGRFHEKQPRAPSGAVSLFSAWHGKYLREGVMSRDETATKPPPHEAMPRAS